MTAILKWIPSVLAVILSLLGYVDAPLQAWIAAHPAAAAIIAALYAILSHLVPSPLSPARTSALKTK